MVKIKTADRGEQIKYNRTKEHKDKDEQINVEYGRQNHLGEEKEIEEKYRERDKETMHNEIENDEDSGDQNKDDNQRQTKERRRERD